MSMHNHGDEKVALNPDLNDERYSPLYGLSDPEYTNVCRVITARAARYADQLFVDDSWFEHDFTESDHETLGIALRFVDMNIAWANPRNRFRNHEWNNFLVMVNNTFSTQLQQYALNTRRSTIRKLLEIPDARMMHTVIKNTLDKLFDTAYPDANDYEQVDDELKDLCRDQLASSMSHACFTVAGNITNVCWVPASEYDVQISHFFRTVLFHFLAIVKLIIGVQNYYVSSNLMMITHTSLCNVSYRQVDLEFSIALHDEYHVDSSDDEMKDEFVEEDRDEDREVSSEENDESTFTITHGADGTTTMHQPEVFTRITQSVERGRILSEREQMEELVRLVLPSLDLEQLESILAHLARHVLELREHAAMMTQRDNHFFSTTTFSSDSEDDE